jgi:Flp pilus assembly protein TadG
MSMKPIFSRLLQSLHKFTVTQGGNVAITFAIAILPVAGAVGAAVDYSHANSVKAALQSALDSTALMLSKNAATVSSGALQTEALGYFTALFTKPEAKNISIAAAYSASGGSNVVVNGSVSVPTAFMGMMGINSITVNGSSTVKWGSAKLRVALVLDNTGSMADSGKITALKTATNNLLTQLQNAASTNGDVYVSIIPFVKDVSVDSSSNYNGNWIDWTDWSAAPANSTPSTSVGPGSSCPYSNNSNGFTCTTGPSNGASSTNTIPSSGANSGYICPSMDSGSKNSVKLGIFYNGCYNSVPTTNTTTVSTGKNASCNGYSNCTCTGSGNSKTCTQTTTGAPYTHTWLPNATSTWNGCITDRGTTAAPSSANYDENTTTPILGTLSSYYPAEQYSNCPLEMVGLNYNWSSMSSLVNQMTPNGSTNQPIGLVWGWQSLVGGGPLTAPAMTSGYTYQQIIILLTDGLNTQDRWYGDGSTTNTSVDSRMYNSSGNGTCANIKAAGITIYTIQVDTGGDPTSTLLQNCATDSTKFFLLTSANQIVTTFNTIGTNLTNLYVSK